MNETSIEDLRRIAQKLRQTLDYDDLAALAGMLTTSDSSMDQPPDKLAQLPKSEIKHALDRMTPAARAIWRERQQRKHESNLEAGLKRWPQAKRLGL